MGYLQCKIYQLGIWHPEWSAMLGKKPQQIARIKLLDACAPMAFLAFKNQIPDWCIAWSTWRIFKLLKNVNEKLIHSSILKYEFWKKDISSSHQDKCLFSCQLLKKDLLNLITVGTCLRRFMSSDAHTDLTYLSSLINGHEEVNLFAFEHSICYLLGKTC